ncbi:MAG: hypothetical protein Q8R34_01970 [bacterium]|nr:hypothetical protein [bacterium]
MRNISKNNKKLLSLILVFIFGFTTPLYFSLAVPSVDFSYIAKEFGLDLVARAISRKLLTDLSNGIIKSINTLGAERPNNPKPSFVQNWKSFLAGAQTIGENQFRAQLNYSIREGILCDDLKGPLSLAFQASNVPFVDIGDPNKNAELKQNTLTPYQNKVRCTIPDQTRAEFKKDFEKGGGWDTWSRMLEPQNNLSGATLLSIEELQKQRASQEQAHQNETVAGQGFQGVKNSCQGIGSNAQCSFLGNTVTPGKILGEAGANFIDANSKWFVSSDELSEVLISIVGAAVNKLANFGPANLIIEGLEPQPVPGRIETGLEETQKEGPLPLNSYCQENAECQSGICGEDPGINSKVCIDAPT